MLVGAANRDVRWSPFPIGLPQRPRARSLFVAVLLALTATCATVALSRPDGRSIESVPQVPAVPGLGVEVPELRTANSRTYQQPDGKLTAQISAQATNFRTAAGTFEPIDNTLVATLGSLRNRANSYTVDLPQRLGAHPIRVQNGDDWISFALQGAAPATAIAAGATARYANALPGVDVTYAAGATGVKEAMVLNRAGTATSFTFDVSVAAGLSPRILESGAIGLVDAAGAQRMTLAAPFMVDAAGASSRAVEYALARNGGGWSLTMAADPKWVAAEGRQFPVTVDPTVELASASQCIIQRWHNNSDPEAENDFGGNCSIGLYVGLIPDLDFYWHSRPLVRWDLSSIPTSAEVTSAAAVADFPVDYTAYPLTRGFTSAATWDQPWTTRGGDFDGSSGVTSTTDLDQIVQGWVDGTRANHGLIFVNDDEVEYGGQGEVGDLTVTYTTPDCHSDPFTAAQSSSASTAYAWNQILLDVFRERGGPPAPLARAAAMMHAGIYDVFNSIYFANLEANSTGTPTNQACGWEKFYVLAEANAATNADQAAGVAARDILLDAIPSEATFINAAFNARHPGSLQTAATQLGTFVANTVKAARLSDGSGDSTLYTWSLTSGAWRPTEDVGCSILNPAAPATPNWGRVTPFTMSSGSQFRQPLPAYATTYSSLLASGTYKSNFDDVKKFGRFDSAFRSTDQTEAAWFWANDLDDTYKPPGQMLEHAELVAQTQPAAQTTGDPEAFFDTWSQQGIRVARLLAETSIALADAAIAAWDQKYETSIDLWRPVTAIQQAGSDGNPDTAADINWQPLSANRDDVHFSPCFPAWVSGHATFGGAWGRVMENEFEHVVHDDPFPLTLTTEDYHSLRDFDDEREFDSFAEASQENARSRIWLGVHYQFDGTDGLATGRAVADHVTETRLRPIQTCPGWSCTVPIPSS